MVRSAQRGPQCKSVAHNDGELVIELDREIQGNAVTFIYKAKLGSEGLSGTVGGERP